MPLWGYTRKDTRGSPAAARTASIRLAWASLSMSRRTRADPAAATAVWIAATLAAYPLESNTADAVPFQWASLASAAAWSGVRPATRAEAPAPCRFAHRRRHHPGVVRQAQIVVRGEVDQPPPVNLDPRFIDAGNDPPGPE